jgi:hypothetical protein
MTQIKKTMKSQFYLDEQRRCFCTKCKKGNVKLENSGEKNGTRTFKPQTK